MKIALQKIKISDLVQGYKRDEESGEVVGYGSRLNIRPAYQREFVYKDKQRDEVIRTIFKGFPLNSIYWVKNGDSYEVLDGQQRTISICDYHNGDFSVDEQYFHNLAQDKKEKFLRYELMRNETSRRKRMRSLAWVVRYTAQRGSSVKWCRADSASVYGAARRGRLPRRNRPRRKTR